MVGKNLHSVSRRAGVGVAYDRSRVRADSDKVWAVAPIHLSPAGRGERANARGSISTLQVLEINEAGLAGRPRSLFLSSAACAWAETISVGALDGLVGLVLLGRSRARGRCSAAALGVMHVLRMLHGLLFILQDILPAGARVTDMLRGL
jgi:hypothetical protein